MRAVSSLGLVVSLGVFVACSPPVDLGGADANTGTSTASASTATGAATTTGSGGTGGTGASSSTHGSGASSTSSGGSTGTVDPGFGLPHDNAPNDLVADLAEDIAGFANAQYVVGSDAAAGARFFLSRHVGPTAGWRMDLGTGGLVGSSPLRLAVNGDGTRLAVTGSFKGSMTIGTQTLDAVGSEDMFLALFDSSNCSPIWATSFGSTDLAGFDNHVAVTLGESFAFDADGDIALVAALEGHVDLGAGEVAPGDVVSLFSGVTGHALWSTPLDAAVSSHLAISQSGTIAVASKWYPEPSAPDMTGVFVNTLDPSTGAVGFSGTFEGDGAPTSITYGGDEGVFVTGTFGHDLNFGNNMVLETASGQTTAFIARVVGGSAEWATTIGDSRIFQDPRLSFRTPSALFLASSVTLAGNVGGLPAAAGQVAVVIVDKTNGASQDVEAYGAIQSGRNILGGFIAPNGGELAYAGYYIFDDGQTVSNGYLDLVGF